MEKWWHLQKEEVAERFKTDINQGLSSVEVDKRVSQYGPNQLAAKPGKSVFALFFDQFRDFIIWVLIAAALISGFLQEWVDATGHHRHCDCECNSWLFTGAPG